MSHSVPLRWCCACGLGLMLAGLWGCPATNPLPALDDNENMTPEFSDADGDGVPDEIDACAGADDRQDADADGTPDACEMDNDNTGPAVPPSERNDLAANVSSGGGGAAVDLRALVVGTAIVFAVGDGGAPIVDDVATGACTCAWSVDPTSAGMFDPPDACITTFLALRATGSVIRMVQTCGEESAEFVQGLVAAAPPVEAPPPVVNAGLDQVADEGTTVRLIGSARPGGDALLSFRWLQLSGPIVDLEGDDNAEASFTAPEVSANQNLEFRLVVTEGDLVADDDVLVTVFNTSSGDPGGGGGGGGGGGAGGGGMQTTNTPPTARLVNASNVTLQDTGLNCQESLINFLDGSTSTDVEDGTNLMFEWSSTVPQDTFGTPNSSRTNMVAFGVGSRTITLTVTDSMNDTGTATILANLVNLPPTANNLVTSTPNNTTPVMASLSGNDTESDLVPGAVLQFFVTSLPAPTMGSLRNSAGNAVTVGTLLPTPMVTYTPNTGFGASFTDTFSFRSFDGCSASLQAATVTIGVALPVATPRLVGIIENQARTVQLIGDDPQNDNLTFSLVVGSGPTNGTLGAITPTGGPPIETANVTYTPTPNFNGADDTFFNDDSFDYRGMDPGGSVSNVASVDLEVYPEVRFTVFPLTNVSRTTPVTMIARTVAGTAVDPNPVALYQWVLDGGTPQQTVLAGTRETHSQMMRTFTTGGLHTVRLSLVLAGFGAYTTCRTTQSPPCDGVTTGVASVTVRPLISGIISETGLVAPNTRLAGVTVTANGDDVTAQPDFMTTSDANGQYAIEVPFGWTGAVTKTLAPFVFAPPATIYNGVGADGQESVQASGPDVTISGSVRRQPDNAVMAGVTINAAGLGQSAGVNRTVTTNASGQYSFSVPFHWSGTVTPTFTSFTFSPANRFYNNRTSNTAEIDPSFVGTHSPVMLSGTVTVEGGGPLLGVTLNAVGNGVFAGTPTISTTTNGSGQYTLSIPFGWSGTVTPDRPPLFFNPVNRAYAGPGTFTEVPITGQNYASTGGIPVTGAIRRGDGVTLASGRSITMEVRDGVGTLVNSVATTTGIYTAVVPVNFTGTITPVSPSTRFEPLSVAHVAVNNPIANEDYVALFDFFVDRPGDGQGGLVDGNDVFLGTEMAPVATPQRAAVLVKPGDQVFIRAGTYVAPNTNFFTPVLNIVSSGTAARPIRFQNFGSDIIILDCRSVISPTNNGNRVGIQIDNGFSHLQFSGFTVIDAFREGINVKGDNVLVENCITDRCGLNISPSASGGIRAVGTVNDFLQNATIRRCVMRHGYSGFSGEYTSNTLVEDCLAHDNLTFAENGDGYETAAANAGSVNMVLRRCIAGRNGDDGYDFSAQNDLIAENCIAFDMDPTNDPMGDGNGFKVRRNSNNITIHNCIAIRCPGFGIGNGESNNTNIYYVNNTAYASGSLGFSFNGSLTFAWNNVGQNSGTDDVFVTAGPGSEVNFNCWADGSRVAGHDANSLTANPNFANPDAAISLAWQGGFELNDTRGIMPTIQNVRNQVTTNFTVLGGSAVINRGIFSTATTAAGANTTTIEVTDDPRRLFSVGAQIQVQGAGLRTIVGLTANSITVDSAVSFTMGQGVHVLFNGTSPDMGAFETP